MASYRFWQKVQPSEGCWEWLGARDRDGYGVTQVALVWMNTHRRAWELTHGPIPEGAWVLHRCDNRGCVRPSHLWLGDNAANSRDRDEKGRLVVPPGKDARGAPWRTDAELVPYIGQYLARVLPARVLASHWGLCVQQAGDVIRRTRGAYRAGH